MQKNVLVGLIGPSGCGKSWAENLMSKNLSYKKLISSTTREPREGEVDGVDYYFLKKEEWDSSEFIEEVEFAGNKYGLKKSELDTEKNCVVVIEPNGAKQILQYLKENPILTPFLVHFDISSEERIKNMKKRGDSEESIQKRIESDDIEDRMEGLQTNMTISRKMKNIHFVIDTLVDIYKKNLRD